MDKILGIDQGEFDFTDIPEATRAGIDTSLNCANLHVIRSPLKNTARAATSSGWQYISNIRRMNGY